MVTLAVAGDVAGPCDTTDTRASLPDAWPGLKAAAAATADKASTPATNRSAPALIGLGSSRTPTPMSVPSPIPEEMVGDHHQLAVNWSSSCFQSIDAATCS